MRRKSYLLLFLLIMPLFLSACSNETLNIQKLNLGYNMTSGAFIFHNYSELHAFVKEHNISSDEEYIKNLYLNFRLKCLKFDNQFFDKSSLIIYFTETNSTLYNIFYINKIYEELYCGEHDFYFNDIVELYKHNPNLKKINELIRQKELI